MKKTHVIINDVWETIEGKECVLECMEKAFPNDCLRWNLEVLNSRELRDELFKKIEGYVNNHDKFDLILLLTTGGARFFYSKKLYELGNIVEILPYSTTHHAHEKIVGRYLLKSLEKIRNNEKLKILILDGEIGIWGCTEQKFYKLKNAIELWANYYEKEIEIKGGCGIVVKGHLDPEIISFCGFPEYGHSVSRLSEDILEMYRRNAGTELESFKKLVKALYRRCLTGTIPF